MNKKKRNERKDKSLDCKFYFKTPVYKVLSECPLVVVNNLTISSSGENILENINLPIYPTTRAGIIGLNGSGKSTLIKMISNNYSSDIFKIETGYIWRQDSLKIGLFEQSCLDKFKDYMEKSSLEYFMMNFKKQNLKVHDARCFLARFGIKGDMVFQKIKTLSGGEKTRLAMAVISKTEPDIFIFDEPTNHLDMETIDFFIEGLRDYKGAFLIISHNQHLFTSPKKMEEVTSLVEELWLVENKNIQRLDMTFDEYKKDIIRKISNI